MRIVNGIAYADGTAKEMKVSDIRALDGYKLWLRFSNNETGVFDFSPLLKEEAFACFTDKKIFDNVAIEYGIPVWNGGETDISPQYLYDNSEKMEVQEEA